MKLTQFLFIFFAGMSSAVWGTVYFDNGGPYTIDDTIDDSVNISNGIEITLTEGGSVSGNVRLEYDAGTFIMTGGSINNDLTALAASPVHIYGGIINDRISVDSSSLSGSPDDNVYIYGTDFKIDNIAVPYGVYHLSGHLNGILSNGDPIDVDFNCSGGNDLILSPVPEPATLSLLAFGLFALRYRKHG
jgi:hypothetical protein